MHQTAIINVVGLSASLLGDRAPAMTAFARAHGQRQVTPVLPAVTCSVQSSMLTGTTPARHGIVGNGWFNREFNEVQFWKQSNALVQGEKLWDRARAMDPDFTVANMFWWYNMYADVDVSVTPRPMYKADGRKLPDVYTEPPDLRAQLQEELGTFPLFNFWGPASSIASSRWITEASKRVHTMHDPTLMLIYLPHLDYGLQKLGPDHPAIPQHVREIDDVVGDLLAFFAGRDVRVMIVSEYGIEPVSRVVEINRILREMGMIRVRDETGHEILDAGASRAFAVADHQIAHVYVKSPEDIEIVAARCRSLPGVAEVLDRAAQCLRGIDHARAGELVLVADAGAWFAYPYWLDDARAPDFARTVDIHRKPGYDPLELFIDPSLRFPKLTLATKLLRKKLGFRTLFDVIPLDPSLVRGSHGRDDTPDALRPLLLGPNAPLPEALPEVLPCTAIADVVLACLGGAAGSAADA
jgi:predicted AlkP superfamily pyrophosphatase or phosphodiesterase